MHNETKSFRSDLGQGRIEVEVYEGNSYYYKMRICGPSRQIIELGVSRDDVEKLIDMLRGVKDAANA